MLQDIIVQQWREATRVDTLVQAIASEDVREARDFFQNLKLVSSEDEARDQLVRGDTERNRHLAWLLFNDLLQLNITTEAERIQALLDWTSLIAEFRNGLKYRDDALEGHCKFYQGILEHDAEHLNSATESYKSAETEYRDVGASPVLQGIAIYAQGLVALERDNTGSSEAREEFHRAMTMLYRATSATIAREVQAAIDRSLQQWQLVSELMQSDRADALLDAHRELVELELLKILKARTRTLAVEGHDVNQVLKVARNVEKVATYIGQPSSFTDDLLNFYVRSHQDSAVEWILREQLKTNTGNLELQKKLLSVMLQQGKNSEVHPLVEDALKFHPDDAYLHELLGTVLFNLDDLPGAQAHFRHALELNPDAIIASAALQEKRFRAMEPQAAVSFRDGNLVISGDISNIAPGELAAAMSAAILAEHPEQIERFFAEAEPELARRVVELLQAQGLFPSSSRPIAEQYLEQAEHFFAQARWEEAIEYYDLAIKSDPDLAKGYMGLGDVYYRIGQYYLAIAHFEESIAIQPDQYTYRFLGDAYTRTGKSKQALEAYRQALKLNPNYAGARQALQQLEREGAEL